MRNIPKVVQTLITSTPDATRIRDGLTNAIQPTLDFLNGYFSAAADGTLRVLKNLQAQGTATFNGATTINGLTTLTNDLNINRGNLLINTRSSNGVVIVPTGGNPPFFITNPANTQALFLVSDAGVCNAQSFVSAAGFKQTISFGYYWNTSYSGNEQQTLTAIVAGSTAAVTGFTLPMSFSGSIVAVKASHTGGLTATCGIAIYKNGVKQFTVNQAANSSARLSSPVAKGQYVFSPGDWLSATVAYSSGGNVCTQVFVEIEESA